MKRNFNDIYEKIYKNFKDEIDAMKKKNTKDTLIMLATIAILFFTFRIIDEFFSYVILCFGMLVFLINFIRTNNNYRHTYKSKVIASLVKEYSSSFRYMQTSSMTKREYNMSWFDTNYDHFYTEDEIYGKLEDGSELKMAQIRTLEDRQTRDSNGNVHTEQIETFKGIYGYVKFDPSTYIPNRIQITSNSILKTYAKNRIELESADFEKRYDVCASDKLHAMQIFTSDLIEKFLDLNYSDRYILEMKIEDTILFFKYRCGDVFEPPALSTGISFELLREFFSIINFPVELTEQIIENAKHAQR